jgi:predicted esterase
VFYLSEDKLGKIKHKPHLAWDLFQSTKLNLYALHVESSELKLCCAPESETSWHVDFVPCYTARYFCLLVRIDSVNIASKDRAYQNGGGFALLLANPKEGNQDTDEFTVFGICPFEDREPLQWSRFFVYYKDVDLVFQQSKEAQIIVEKTEHFSYVLVLIPWKLAEPLTPFITKEIGLNFWAAQAIEAEIPVQFHMLLQSEKLIAEQQLRDYALYEFEEPLEPQHEHEITYMLERKHLSLGTSSTMHVAVNSPYKDHIAIKLWIDDAEVANTNIVASKGITRNNVRFGTERLGVGLHQLRLEILGRNLSYCQEMNISIYDPDWFSKMKESINKLKHQKADSTEIAESIVTLEYLLETSFHELEKLKPYSPFDELQKRFDRIQEGVSQVKSNESLFVRGKSIRMGLRSRQDKTLQPYSLYIPETFKTGQGGLIILLHGSGTNDTAMVGKSSRLAFFERTGMIIAAPFARGESHYYLPKEAMEEIVELTEKMMKMFSVPKEKVVLVGFSMGGFGVINTYFYKPDLYRNLMVFSGSFDLKPYVAQPDWSTDDALRKLAATNLIIFHGEGDLNMPYEKQKSIHEKLKKMSPNVEIVIAKRAGHEVAPEWEKKALEYLDKVSKI